MSGLSSAQDGRPSFLAFALAAALVVPALTSRRLSICLVDPEVAFALGNDQVVAADRVEHQREGARSGHLLLQEVDARLDPTSLGVVVCRRDEGTRALDDAGLLEDGTDLASDPRLWGSRPAPSRIPCPCSPRAHRTGPARTGSRSSRRRPGRPTGRAATTRQAQPFLLFFLVLPRRSRPPPRRDSSRVVVVLAVVVTAVVAGEEGVGLLLLRLGLPVGLRLRPPRRPGGCGGG